jgi:hypothetical protein
MQRDDLYTWKKLGVRAFDTCKSHREFAPVMTRVFINMEYLDAVRAVESAKDWYYYGSFNGAIDHVTHSFCSVRQLIMINLIIGRPGGDKSYEAVKYHILPAIKAGRKIITNLSLNIDTFVQVFGADVSNLIAIVKTEYDDFGNLNRPFSKVEDYQE